MTTSLSEKSLFTNPGFQQKITGTWTITPKISGADGTFNITRSGGLCHLTFGTAIFLINAINNCTIVLTSNNFPASWNPKKTSPAFHARKNRPARSANKPACWISPGL